MPTNISATFVTRFSPVRTEVFDRLAAFCHPRQLSPSHEHVVAETAFVSYLFGHEYVSMHDEW
jgi:hypothetical protein